MAVLVDTNILLRLAQPLHSDHRIARDSVDSLRVTDGRLTVAVQNLIEFWVVATRPQQGNGLGIDVERARKEISALKSSFEILAESDKIFQEWERLIGLYKVSGKNAHDARLVAAMKVNGISKILTFNAQDFARYREIEVIHPGTIS